MWYNKVTNDITVLPDFITYYENELTEAKKELSLKGNIEKHLAALPGVTDHRFAQIQEIEAVLNFLNIMLGKIKQKHHKQYLEHYPRELSSRDIEKYVSGEQEVVDYQILINEVALLRNKWLGIMKGLESKGFQISNIVRLRCAGLDGAELG